MSKRYSFSSFMSIVDGHISHLTTVNTENSKSAIASNSKGKAKVADWRVPIVTYLKNLDHGAERNIRRLTFKYILIDDVLYR